MGDEDRTCPNCGRKCAWWAWSMRGRQEKTWCEHCKDEAKWKPLPGQTVMDFGKPVERTEVRDA